MNETLQLLKRMSQGDAEAEDQLYKIVHSELHERAGHMMRQQGPGHTLQATALVNEAWIKLSRVSSSSWEDRTHFLRTASRAMQSVLVDHARAKLSHKRGGDRARVDFNLENAERNDPSWRMIALNEALERLSNSHPDQHRVAQMRIFGGLSHAEIARLSEVPLRTVERQWSAAREALRDAL